MHKYPDIINDIKSTLGYKIYLEKKTIWNNWEFLVAKDTLSFETEMFMETK